MPSCHASLRLVLLATLALPMLTGERAAAASPPPMGPRPPAAVFPPLQPQPPSAPARRVFARAAARSGVPLALLLAVSYVQSHWGDHGGRPSIDGGYGLLDLGHTPQRDTLDAAARLLGVPPGRVAHEDALNVLGGARLLARAARALAPHHRLPRTLDGWAPAVVWLTGLHSRLATQALLRDVYGLLAHDVALAGHRGRAAQPGGRWPAAPGAVANQRTGAPLLPLPAAARGPGADYPGAIWAPSPNYAPARQPATARVRYVVIHDTEGSCAAALNWLDEPASGSSAHFLVCQDGTVYQLVHLRDVAWHAGNRYINQHAIGIEHEGFRDAGGYTQAQYDASAALVRWLDTIYGLHIQRDRNAIFGHDNVPDGGHTDPGPYWDWAYYMSRVRGGAPYDGGNPRVALVVAPEALFYDCPAPSCRVEGSADWGEQFAVVRTAGGWDEVDYNGHAAWVAGAAVTAGIGVRLRVGAAHLPVHDEPRRSAHVMGSLIRGQIYVSRLLDHAPDRDRQGWWLIAYNHRYGFINCGYAQPLGQPLPPDCVASPAAPPAVLPHAPTPCGATPLSSRVTATASATATATASATVTTATPVVEAVAPAVDAVAAAVEIVEPATTNAPSGTVTPSVTITEPVPATATGTGTASPQAGTATATTTMMDTASLSATGTPTAGATSTATQTPTSTSTPTPTATMTPTATPTATMTPTATPTSTVAPSPSATATPLELRTLVVSLSPAHAGLGKPLHVCVYTNVGRALVRYRLDLPAGVTLRANGHTDAQGNVERTFILPGKRWRAEVLRRTRRQQHGRASMPRLPHSLGAGYAVSVTWRGHALSRRGRFRIVL